MRSLFALAFFLLASGVSFAQEKTIGPIKVQIKDESTSVVERDAAIDPVRRVETQSQPNMAIRITVEGKALVDQAEGRAKRFLNLL